MPGKKVFVDALLVVVAVVLLLDSIITGKRVNVFLTLCSYCLF
jgi:hypothetical protein